MDDILYVDISVMPKAQREQYLGELRALLVAQAGKPRSRWQLWMELVAAALSVLPPLA